MLSLMFSSRSVNLHGDFFCSYDTVQLIVSFLMLQFLCLSAIFLFYGVQRSCTLYKHPILNLWLSILVNEMVKLMGWLVWKYLFCFCVLFSHSYKNATLFYFCFLFSKICTIIAENNIFLIYYFLFSSISYANCLKWEAKENMVTFSNYLWKQETYPKFCCFHSSLWKSLISGTKVKIRWQFCVSEHI